METLIAAMLSVAAASIPWAIAMSYQSQHFSKRVNEIVLSERRHWSGLVANLRKRLGEDSDPWKP